MKTSSPFLRRVALAGVTLLTVAALASCASDDSDTTAALGSTSDTAATADTATADTTIPPTLVPETTAPVSSVPDSSIPSTPSTSVPNPATSDTAAPGGGTDFPVGANEVVLKIDSGIGGFRTFQSTFAAIPTLLVTGDGRVFTEGPVTMIFPGAFLPNLQVAQADRAMISELMKSADSAGLLGTIPDYTVGVPNVTDVGSTVLSLTAKGKTYVHEAYALGMEQGDAAPARKVLKDFIEAAKSKLSILPSEKFVPETYLLATQPADISPDTTVDPATGNPQPRFQLWPADLGINLKDLKCAPVVSSKVQAMFEKADQLTYFFQDSGVYSLAVRPVFPGQPGCESIN